MASVTVRTREEIVTMLREKYERHSTDGPSVILARELLDLLRDYDRMVVESFGKVVGK